MWQQKRGGRVPECERAINILRRFNVDGKEIETKNEIGTTPSAKFGKFLRETGAGLEVRAVH